MTLEPLNRAKCKYMHLGNEYTSNAYRLAGMLLEPSSQEKDLGILISNYMKTRAHTELVCCSAKRVLGAIRRSFLKLSPKAFEILYSAHIRSRLEYASVVTFP